MCWNTAHTLQWKGCIQCSDKLRVSLRPWDSVINRCTLWQDRPYGIGCVTNVKSRCGLVLLARLHSSDLSQSERERETTFPKAVSQWGPLLERLSDTAEQRNNKASHNTNREKSIVLLLQAPDCTSSQNGRASQTSYKVAHHWFFRGHKRSYYNERCMSSFQCAISAFFSIAILPQR